MALHPGDGSRGLAHRRGRLAARLQRAVIQHRLAQHEAEAAGLVGQLAGKQFLPREGVRVPGGGGAQGAVEAVQCRRHAGDGLVVRHALHHQAEGGEQPAQAGVGVQLAQEGLGVDGAVEDLLQVRFADEQERIFLQIRQSVGLADLGEMGVVGGEFGGQGGRGRFGFLGDAGADYGHDQVVVLREKVGERVGALLPVEIGREHAAGIGRDPEIGPRAPQAGRGQQGSDQQDQATVARTGSDQGRQDGPGGRGDVHRGRSSFFEMCGPVPVP